MKEIKEDSYHLLHPRMAVFITSKRNAMACAWITPASEEPPIVAICLSKKGFTSELIQETEEFGVCIPNEKLVDALMKCGSVSGRDVDKFKECGIEKLEAKRISVSLVKGCVGYIECKLSKTVEAGECFVFFGDVVAAYADEKKFDGNWKTKIPFHGSGNEILYFKD